MSEHTPPIENLADVMLRVRALDWAYLEAERTLARCLAGEATYEDYRSACNRYDDMVRRPFGLPEPAEPQP